MKVLCIGIVLGAFLVLLAAPAVQAQGAPPFPYFPSDTRPLLSCSGYYCGDAPEGTPETKCTSLCDLLHTGQNFLYFGLTLLMVVIVPLMLVIGFIFVIISAGSRERLGTGRNIIKGGILALLLGMGAFVLLNTFFKGIGIVAGGSAGGGWSTINCNPEELPGTIDPEKLCLDVGGTGGGGRGGGGKLPGCKIHYEVRAGFGFTGPVVYEWDEIHCSDQTDPTCKKLDECKTLACTLYTEEECTTGSLPFQNPTGHLRVGCWTTERGSETFKFSCEPDPKARTISTIQCAPALATPVLPVVAGERMPPWVVGPLLVHENQCNAVVGVTAPLPQPPPPPVTSTVWAAMRFSEPGDPKLLLTCFVVTGGRAKDEAEAKLMSLADCFRYKQTYGIFSDTCNYVPATSCEATIEFPPAPPPQPDTAACPKSSLDGLWLDCGGSTCNLSDPPGRWPSGCNGVCRAVPSSCCNLYEKDTRSGPTNYCNKYFVNQQRQ